MSCTKIYADKRISDEQIDQATYFIINCFEKLTSKNLIKESNLRRLLVGEYLLNPLSEIDIDASHEAFIYGEQINKIIEKYAHHIDLETIKLWAYKKQKQLEEHNRTREVIKEKTRPTHIPFLFVPLPVVNYTDTFDEHSESIPAGTEIQETLVTQYQWAKIMGYNPVVALATPDTTENGAENGSALEEIVINDRKILMRPDAPVSNVSYKDIQEFLIKLNEQDTEHRYALPSVNEFVALIRACLGKEWLTQLKDHAHLFRKYLAYGKTRVWDVTGPCWQWTRDRRTLSLEDYAIGDDVAYLAFGGVSVSNLVDCNLNSLTDLLRLLPYISKSKAVYLRLIRYPKTITRDSYTYSSHHLLWDQRVSKQDQEREWHELFNIPFFFDDGLSWMLDYRSYYSEDVKHTLKALIKEAGTGIDDSEIAEHLKQRTGLDLVGKKIDDLTPLKYLTNLERLDVSNNMISDIAPLARLTRLQKLRLNKNGISDLMPLKQLTNLVALNLEHNQVRDITPLAYLTDLIGLMLGHNMLREITALRSLTKLESLDFDYNKVSDITALTSLLKLFSVRIGHNKVRDVSPLLSLSSLSYVFVEGNPLVDTTVLVKLQDKGINVS